MELPHRPCSVEQSSSVDGDRGEDYKKSDEAIMHNFRSAFNSFKPAPFNACDGNVLGSMS